MNIDCIPKMIETIAICGEKLKLNSVIGIDTPTSHMIASLQ